jgi:hypothetical protein
LAQAAAQQALLEQEEELLEAVSPARAAGKGAQRSAPPASPGIQPPKVVKVPVQAVSAPALVTPPQSSEPEVSSEMKDILSSVFGDDEASERQAALLQGMDNVDITHLLTLTQQVAAQLQGNKPVRVVGSEELEYGHAAR